MNILGSIKSIFVALFFLQHQDWLSDAQRWTPPTAAVMRSQFRGPSWHEKEQTLLCPKTSGWKLKLSQTICSGQRTLIRSLLAERPVGHISVSGSMRRTLLGQWWTFFSLSKWYLQEASGKVMFWQKEVAFVFINWILSRFDRNKKKKTEDNNQEG